VDYDADGDEDILSGSYTGEVYYFEATAPGVWKQGVYLRNMDGNVLNVGISLTPEAHDMDADGDLDLLIGTRSDGVFVFENRGTRSLPQWSADGIPLKTSPGDELEGSNAHLADWDGDGKLDIVAGSEWGGAHWYQNVGKAGQFVFAASQELVARGKFMERTEEDGPVGPGSRTKVHAMDYNADGKMDLLVGDVQWLEYQLQPLTAKEKAEKQAFKPKYKAAEATYDQAVDERNSHVGKPGGIPEEVLQRYQNANDVFAPFRRQWSGYNRSRTNTHGWVWLYLGE